MKLSIVALIAAVAGFASAQTAAESAALTAILNDIKTHTSDYLDQIMNGNSPPDNLLSLVQQAQTYTDDSFTTLYAQVNMAQVTSYITGLPWYSSRLVPAISSATAA